MLLFFLLCAAQTMQAQQVYTFNYSGSVVNWTVPAGVTKVSIEAKGAQGGDNISLNGEGGKGANIKGEFTVVPGEVLKIVVGEMGHKATIGDAYNGAGGGGGGSFVWIDNSSQPLIAAGGGGGSSLLNNGAPHYRGKDGAITIFGTGSRSHDINNNSPGGVNGADGTTVSASGGKGWFSVKNNPSGTLGGTYGAKGGFGGGGGGGLPGSACNYLHNAGGGGGYSGGGAGGSCYYFGGGGGGSYNAGINQLNIAGANSGNGQVIITSLYSASISETKSIACAGDATGELTATVSGGTGPYTYSWSPSGKTGAIASNLSAGDHTVTVTDALGAVITATKTIAVNDTQAPVITKTGTKVINVPAGQSSNWNMYTHTFADPLPAGAKVTGVTLTYSGRDQGWGGTGQWSRMIVSGTQIGGNQYFGSSQNFTINYTGEIPGYLYGGNNYLRQDFDTWGGWVAYFEGGTMTIHYEMMPDVKGQCTATVTTAPTAIDNCGGTITGTTTDPLTYSTQGTHIITWSFTDGSGNTSTGTQNVIVQDVTPPVVTIQNITVQLDASGNAVITPAQINNGSTDNCGVASVTLDKTTFDCSNIGSNIVTLTVKDFVNNTTTATATVTVEDKVAPVAIAKNITVQLNASGAATITAAQIDNGSTDACGSLTFALSKTSFDCTNVGPNTVNLTVTDKNGNASNATAVVTVEDKVTPVAVAKNITVQLNASGAATITAAQIDNGSTDNCAIKTLTISKTSFDCSNIGLNTVTLTATDESGNVSTATAVVTVEDKVAPVAVAKNITVKLDANGQATILAPATVTTIFNEDFAADGIATRTVYNSITNWNVLYGSIDVGDWIPDLPGVEIDLAGWENAGIETKETFELTPGTYNFSVRHRRNSVDKPFTVYIGDIANHTFTSTSQAKLDEFTFKVSATTTVRIKLEQDGTSSSSGSFISDIVLSKQTPESLAIDGGSYDNCDVQSIIASQTDFTCANVGANNVTLTVKDKSGNESTATAVVTVLDETAPIAIAQNLTVTLSATGTATITAAQVDNGSSDACGIGTMTLDKTSFDCTNVGVENIVTLTVKDKSGNESTATAKVTVLDETAPVAIAQNLTVQLNANGTATIVAADVDNGSSDNCGIASLALSKTSFDCTNVGPNTVTLTVTDNSGNTHTATAVVTVEDNILPVAIAQNITVQLDASGNATVTAEQINNGSGDNCGVASFALSKTTFDCSNVGENPVTLTVTDNSGNTHTATAIVTVEDKFVPTVVAQNITVQLDASGKATITPSMIDNGSTDNCVIASMVLDKTEFTCASDATNTVTLTVTDVNGNTSSTTAVVTVVDNIAPVAVTKNITVQLDASGKVSIAAADVDNGSSDNCGIASIALSKTAFDCSNTGVNTVTLTVTDNSGNTHTATAIVTVEDKIAPTITAPANVVVDVDPGKNTASNVALGTPVTADNCSVASVTNNAPSVYPTGVTTVTWTVTDASGNTSTATQTVTVRRDVVGVAQLATVNVPIRTAYANVPLPANVTVTYSNGETGTIGITWAQGNYNGLIAGSYTLTGQLVLAANTTNVNGKVATITVIVEPNKVPTALAFSATTFKPDAKADDVIGTLTTTDPDDTQFVYTLVTGAGDADNSLFEIRGDKVYLKSNSGLSGKTQFTFRVRSTDPYQNTIEKAFTLSKGNYGVAEDKLKIVNAFSPNNDGINDTWFIPELRFYNSVEVEVFDRSGVRLFHTTDPEKGWDGRGLNGQTLKGAFFYIVQVKDISLVKKGVVTIISK